MLMRYRTEAGIPYLMTRNYDRCTGFCLPLMLTIVPSTDMPDRRDERHGSSATAGGGGVNVTAEQQHADTENNTAENVVVNRCDLYEEIAGDFAAESIEPYYISSPSGLHCGSGLNVATGREAFVEVAATCTGEGSPEPPPVRLGENVPGAVLPRLEPLKIDDLPTPDVYTTTSGYCGLSPQKRHAPVPTATAYCHLPDSSTGACPTEHVQRVVWQYPLIETTPSADENVPNSASGDYIRLKHPCTSSVNCKIPAAMETYRTNFLGVWRTGRISGRLGVSRAEDGSCGRPPTPPPPYESYLELSDGELSEHD